MNEIQQKVHARKVQGCINYAMANKSDPFAFNRAMTHVSNGIVGYLKDGSEAFYSATPTVEMRELPDGQTYPATVYHDMKRP